MTKGKARRGFIVWIALILLSTQSVCAEGKTESIQPAAVQEAADAEEQLTQSVYEKRYQREGKTFPEFIALGMLGKDII